MAKRDPERTRRIRIAVRYLLDHGCLAKGNQSRIAEHFQVSRQRVHQIVVEERRRALLRAGVAVAEQPSMAPGVFAHHAGA